MINTLIEAIKGIINRCKDVLKKSGISASYTLDKESTQIIFDPVLFTNYGA